jgi:electron transport complex protein RnfD
MFRVKEIPDSVAVNEKETSDVMLDVIIALMPVAFAGVIYFGRRALAVMVLAVLCCVGFEFHYQKIFRNEVKINDLSPFERRNHNSFKDYFNLIWGEVNGK